MFDVSVHHCLSISAAFVVEVGVPLLRPAMLVASHDVTWRVIPRVLKRATFDSRESSMLLRGGWRVGWEYIRSDESQFVSLCGLPPSPYRN